MVSRANVVNRRMLSRDEIVTRGMEAEAMATHEPYVYDFKWKSGNKRTKRGQCIASSRVTLFGKLISEKAERGRDFFVWNVSRVLRYQAKCRDL